MAARHCSCGRVLEEVVVAELRCADCGPVRAWLVRVGDEAVAAGSPAEVFVTPALLHVGLGLSKRTLEVAAAPDFRPTPLGVSRDS